MKGYTKPVFLIILVLLADQILKTWIKTNMYIGQEFQIIQDFFIIHFTENNGMAFGMEFGGELGKLALSLFRIIAVIGIGYGLHHLIKHKYHRGLILNVSLIFAGALGNIIDSVFYGVIYGYEKLFHGRVVDMFYFPIFTGVFPEWLPVWGGEDFIFFRPVFNIADAAISIGVILILIYQKVYFKEEIKEEPSTNSEVIED
ncbi:lipoprotein signal peptidase [Pedobacter puniceum]|jgi:signal peptidase II|uniref:Lipoprotein signal peptidase n=1 Tax=Pedobacter puniceum TaxID=2666136 RepID=A0A7K0FPU5_9SPHI|nr:lipoprotein signal peptidase [Pedobacter puniceum]MRX47872.1 lipoprotein signal peptidase [Pedobacter puniceum]